MMFWPIAVTIIFSSVSKVVTGFHIPQNKFRLGTSALRDLSVATTHDGWWNKEKRTFYTVEETEKSERVYPIYQIANPEYHRAYTAPKELGETHQAKIQMSPDVKQELPPDQGPVPPISQATVESAVTNEKENNCEEIEEKVIPTVPVSYNPVAQQTVAIDNQNEVKKAIEPPRVSHEAWWNKEKRTFYSEEDTNSSARVYPVYKIANVECHRAGTSPNDLGETRQTKVKREPKPKLPESKAQNSASLASLSVPVTTKVAEDLSETVVTDDRWFNTEVRTFYTLNDTERATRSFFNN